MNRNLLLGFATELGSVNSHTAILARSLGIPAVVGLEGAVLAVKALTPAIIDGYSGKLILDPTEETLSRYTELQKHKERVRHELEAHRDDAAVTQDGRDITLSANIELVEELPLVQNSGAKGVGLYRTEFLLLIGEEIPSETQQSETYTRLA